MNKLVLLDSNSLLNRAFYAMPPMNAIDGTPTAAVLGYVNILMRIIKDIKPTHIVAAFDVKAPTFRKKMYDDYKAQRKPMPEELARQMPVIKELLNKMDIKVVELEGFEADDVIGTLAKQCQYQTIIVTGDKDSLQLVSPSTTVWLTKKGVSEVIEYTPQRLLEEGLTPSQIIDLKALMGDQSDNIPGVPGVGEKTAMSLIEKYKTLDGVYAHTDELKGKMQEKIVDNKELAYLSYTLATIDTDVPITYDEDGSKLVYPFDVAAREYMQKLSFRTVIGKIDFADNGVTSTAVEQVETQVVDIETAEQVEELLQKIRAKQEFSMHYDGNIAIALDELVEYNIARPMDMFAVFDFDWVCDEIKKLFKDNSIKKYLYDIKTLRYSFGGAAINNAQDICLMAYLLKAHITYKDILELCTDYGIEGKTNASNIIKLMPILQKELVRLECDKLYNEVELPLIDVLFEMENVGIKVDCELMQVLDKKYELELIEITKTVHELAGEKFNINSPKQLGEILFQKLGLKHGKKNKGGGYSTNVDILEGLSDEHEIVNHVLRYREIAKLSSTYIKGLEPLLDKHQRLHTIFKQMLTATGRLSSTEPNLQNIPVRKEEGRELRKMFVASEGNKLVSADYSQIELRLLAHFSQDDTLIEAFEQGADIHAYTASKVNGVPLNMVTPEMRSRSKAVNFGIIYGISDFGLAKDIGCAVYEAKTFIEQYFATYGNVKAYLDESVNTAKEHGYAKTLLGRLRFIPDLQSANYNIRSFGERVAKNMPLQGSASDIIKLAMLRVDKALKDNGLKAKLILQVHDELILDCPLDEVKKVSQLLQEAMQGAVKLRVPLVADVKAGDSWFETK